MIGVVDCNNFYASCERLFRPELNGKPIVVLSNNDGCVISRSNEAKALGIRMGVPAFEIKKEIEEFNIHVFSSNYCLYGDLSRRVMQTLEQFASDIEVYSIDEAFLSFKDFEHYDLFDYANTIVRTVHKATGIPISIGIAPTKALSKIANKLAKRSSIKKGVYILSGNDNIIKALKAYPIEDVWGIGGQYAKFLIRNQVLTAYDFTQMPKSWVQKELTVVGVRLWYELQGISKIDLELITPAKKNICTARSFGKMLSDYKSIEEAVSNFASRCAEKLRSQGSCATAMLIYLHTNEHRHDLDQYAKNVVIKLPVATNSTIDMIRYAIYGLKLIFKAGYKYKKVGVIISDFVPENNVQQNLFKESTNSKHQMIMETLDKMNAKLGKDKIRIASQGYKKDWSLRQEKLSPFYTTRLTDIFNIFV